MLQAGKIITLAGSLYLAYTAVARADEHAYIARTQCITEHCSYVELSQKVRSSRRSLYPKSGQSYLSAQKNRGYWTRRRWQHYSADRFALHQIPRPFRFGVSQPLPTQITRACNPYSADTRCGMQRRLDDPFINSLLGRPNSRTIPVLRALGIPAFSDVPPIVTINGD